MALTPVAFLCWFCWLKRLDIMGLVYPTKVWAVGFEVREGVNKTIADVVAWSMQHAASGTYPSRGFYNEEFHDGTYRKCLSGKNIAGGFKLLDSESMERCLCCFGIGIFLDWFISSLHLHLKTFRYQFRFPHTACQVALHSFQSWLESQEAMPLAGRILQMSKALRSVRCHPEFFSTSPSNDLQKHC